MTKFAVLLALAFSFSVQARDMGFRYKSGECVDDQGVKGLNPGYIGQCGNLDRTVISNVDFSQMDLSGSSIQSADLQRSSMTGANLTAVNFSGTDLSGVDFNQAKIYGTNFSNAVLVNAHMAGADVKDARFDNVNFSESVLSYMSFPGCSFAGSNFSGATMDHVELRGADLHGAILEKAILREAILDKANLDQSNLVSSDLRNASLKQITANAAKLRNANLRSAQLQKSTIKAADLRGAQLDSADLSNVDLSGSDVRRAAFTGTVLTGVNFQQVKFDKRTVLPFTKEEAEKLGMVMLGGGKLLLILDYDQGKEHAGIKSLLTFLDNESSEGVVSTELHSQFTGKKDSLEDYSVIFHVTANQYTVDMPADGQKAILNFVKNGGTYILTQFSGYMVDSEGFLQQINDLVLQEYGGSDSRVITFKATPGHESDPLLQGVTKTVGPHSFATGGMRSFSTNPTEILMVDEQQNPMIFQRRVGNGRAIGLALSPYSNTYQLFGEAPIQRLIQNALEL